MNALRMMLAAGLICFATLPAQAMDHMTHSAHKGKMCMRDGKCPHQGQMMMDKNGDGAVTKAEFDAHFAKMDANRDGKISKDEMKSRMKKWKKGCCPKMGCGPMGKEGAAQFNR